MNDCCAADFQGDGPAPDGDPRNWAVEKVYYVDVNYLGGGGDGTLERPFTTIQEGIDLAWLEVASLQFDSWAVVRIASGVYSETDLVLYPFVALVGETEDTVRINNAGAPVRLFSFGDYNFVNLRFQTDFNSDQTSLPFFNFFTWARFWNCRFDAFFTATGIGANVHWYEFQDCAFFGPRVLATDVTFWVQDTASYASLTAHGSLGGAANSATAANGLAYNCFVHLYGGFWAGDIDVDTLSGPQGTWIEIAGRLFGTLQVSGPQSTVQTTTDGMPEDGLTFLLAGDQFASGEAHGGLYEPVTPADWPTLPDTTGQALDLLAALAPPAAGAEVGPIAFGDQSIAATTTTRFLTPCYDSGTAQTTELGIRVQRACNVTAFSMDIRAGAGNGSDVVYTLRVNGADTALTITLASTASGLTTTVVGAPVAVPVNGKLSVKVEKAAGIGGSPADVQAFVAVEAA